MGAKERFSARWDVGLSRVARGRRAVTTPPTATADLFSPPSGMPHALGTLQNLMDHGVFITQGGKSAH
jgi:hypothetical protein